MPETVLTVLVLAVISSVHARYVAPVWEKVQPWNENCHTRGGSCRKGDLVDPSIADCSYDCTWTQRTCTAAGLTGSFIGWVVEEDKDKRCLPVVKDKEFRCGDPGTNTRCVCSDKKFWPNKCRCQYWTEETPGEDKPSFCTLYYMGGVTTVHQYVCCNNCGYEVDPAPQKTSDPLLSHYVGWCDGHTYQGGSKVDYCDSCGVQKGGGIAKSYFNCGNCEIQSKCEERCKSKWRWFYSSPGLCWLWANCFRDCCVSASKQPWH